jgi:predicted PilT family ATPase
MEYFLKKIFKLIFFQYSINNMVLFGQIVIGPPGSGKTTYCFYMKEYYQYFGREVVLVNLDPANVVIDKEKVKFSKKII